jgi:hypothetical protein
MFLSTAEMRPALNFVPVFADYIGAAAGLPQ